MVSFQRGKNGTRIRLCGYPPPKKKKKKNRKEKNKDRRIS